MTGDILVARVIHGGLVERSGKLEQHGAGVIRQIGHAQWCGFLFRGPPFLTVQGFWKFHCLVKTVRKMKQIFQGNFASFLH
jgi:hypothetical protein